MRLISEQDRVILKQRFIRGVYDGLDSRELLLEINVSVSTLSNWRNNDPSFRLGIDRAKKASSLRAIGLGLNKLASGYDEITNKDEWIEENAEGDIIKRSRTVKQVAPNLAAIKTLANKYAPNEYGADSDSGNITIRITQKDRSLTLAERLLVLEGDKSLDSLDDIEVNAKDIKHLEALDLDPPTKD